MRITKVETFVLKAPLGTAQFFSSQAAFPERCSLLVKITADEGLVGWGEGGQYGPAEPVASCIIDVLGPKLVGQPVKHPAAFWETIYVFSRDFGQKGTYIEAMSAIDIALWDIFAQTLGRPVYALIGEAHRTSVTAYATGCYYRQKYLRQEELLAGLEAEAASYIGSGFGILKMKIGLLSVAHDVQRVTAVSRTIGSQIDLLVDANHAYNTATAIRMGRALEELGVLWFEEPVVPEDRRGYRRVRDAVQVPIAGGECEFTRFGFLELFQGECVDIAQPDLCVCGGLSEWIRIQSLALSFGVLTIPHVWGSGVAMAAALHAIATIPPTPHTANPIPLQNEPVVEFDQKTNPLRDDLLEIPFVLKDGKVAVPDGAGLGISVRQEVLKAHTVQHQIAQWSRSKAA
ncbi:MAG: mandelate racemase/muconate lactonizing enzyme family protein [Gemmataceae bacterium]